MVFLIIDNLLLSASLTKIVSNFIIKYGYLDKVLVLPQGKIIDYLNFPIFLFLALVLLIADRKINHNLTKKKLGQNNILIEIVFLFAYLIIYLQADFVSYSGKSLLIFILIVYSFKLFLNKYQKSIIEIKFNDRIFLNGILLGFFLSVLSANITKLNAVPLCLIIVTPIIYLYLGQKYNFLLANPLYLLFIFAIPLSTNLLLLIVLMIVIATLIYLAPMYPNPIKLNKRIIKFLYTVVIVSIFTYNPLFYIGHFDPVEEGFWLSWIDRLRNGQVLYRDFFAFHPPIITEGAYYFMNVFGSSIYNLRLYLQLLQVVGYLFIYLIINYFLKNRWNKILTFITILILTHTFVRNNTVFRVGSGLIALLPLFTYFKNENIKLLIISGILSAVSFFISPEVGLSALLTLSIFSLIIFIKRPKNHRLITFPIFGILLGSSFFIIELFLQRSIGDFIKQIYYYSTAFSGVYNSVIEQPIPEPMFLWIKLNNFIGSTGWFWELTKFSIAAIFMVIYLKFAESKINHLSKSSAALGLFASILTISFLARSDYYHLLFALIPAVIILIYLLELLSTRFKYSDKIFLLFIIFYVLRGTPSDYFIQDSLNKFQAYANPLGNYFKLDIVRGGIYVTDASYPIDIKRLINYIDEKVDINEKIFIYPWSPELYFLSQRENATSFDTPLASFSEEYQKQMVKQLEQGHVNLIIYNPEVKFLNLSVTSLPLVNSYILDNFKKEDVIGNYQVFIPK